ncbi:DUF881 domain-containing protein [Effusibacillus consociatus]|uniref:DUF881 domain-containing protein n=1 Tax=Effusibacillus consociatus TaxID=1117041 RepID=A0ABV9PWF3_9BACL
MSRKQKLDQVTDLLSSLNPLEPRPGLEQEIFARIAQEPVPDEPRKQRDWSWVRSIAAVVSFIGALILIGAFFYSGQQQANMSGAANNPAGLAVKDSASNQIPADAAKGAKKSAVLTSDAVPALSRGVKLTLKEPASFKDQEEAKRVGEAVTPEDLSEILKELYDAGAEWVSVNHVRVSPEDHAEWQGQSLSVRGQPLAPPYVVEVSGDPTELRQAIERKGSRIDTLKRAAKIDPTIETIK